MILDLRPIASKDMILCNNKFCTNRCKRHEDFWKPNNSQTYINPGFNAKVINGILIYQNCNERLD